MKKSNSEIDIYIQKLFEHNAKGIVPTSTFEMMMNKYSKEKELLSEQIRVLVRKQQEEMIQPNNEVKAVKLIELLKSFDDNDILNPLFIQKVIKKIIVKSRPINNSNKNI